MTNLLPSRFLLYPKSLLSAGYGGFTFYNHRNAARRKNLSKFYIDLIIFKG